MLERLLSFSIRRRGWVLLATAAFAVAAAFLLPRLPIDAVPDITTVQVQINTEAAGFSPLEIEQRVTFPIETALGGLPRLELTRSLSRYGLSQVTVVFADGTDIYFARQLVNERLQEVRDAMPAGVTPTMGPIATGLGEIYMYSLSARAGARQPDGSSWDPIALRTLHDWVVRPQLRTVPGVVEVNTIGGAERQIEVTPDPAKLVAYGLTFADLASAIEANNSSVGAGYLERNGEQQLVRVPGQVRTLAEIGEIPIVTRDSLPIRVADVAEVAIGHELRTGAATQNGGEVVLGTAFMLVGENSRVVSRRVHRRLGEIVPSLPDGVVLTTLYDRTTLVDATLRTVAENLVEGALLVVVILFLLLGNFRAALITAAVIPLSMLFTATGMVARGLSGNLMSLGALDFGIVVDGAVIIVENCVHRLGAERARLGRSLSPDERERIVLEASQEVRRATLFGEIIIMIVYLPVLTLGGIEGKMYVPMAITVLLALFGAMILSVTFVPAACAFFLAGGVRVRGNPVLRTATAIYEPALDRVLRRPLLASAASILLVVFSAVLASRMGREFVPSLDEGDIALHALRVPGTSLTQAVAMQHVLEDRVREFPEVERTFSKIGTGDIATDPMPPSVADGFIILKPRSRWPDPRRTKADLVHAIEDAVGEIPGNAYEFTQPIQMRFNELIAGVRADLAIKVFGDDLDLLRAAAERIAAAVERVPGASDVKVEPVSGLPFLNVEIRRDRAARHGIPVAAVQAAVETAIAGRKVGQIYEGDRRFDLVLRLPPAMREDVSALARLPLMMPSGAAVGASPRWQRIELRHGLAGEPRLEALPLGAVADLALDIGPNQISRENGKRRVVVTANVRDRDLGSFVADARVAAEEAARLGPGSWLTLGGQFEHLLSAAARLRLVIPIALVLILALLYASFGSARDAILVFTGIPFALTGGILALWLRGIPLSISAAVGFIALSGVAVLNGLVLLAQMNQLARGGMAAGQAAREGALRRLRPVLMTALVASLGFLPMALATGRGAEVQRPLATVVIGGLLTSTLLTAFVLPALYARVARPQRGPA